MFVPQVVLTEGKCKIFKRNRRPKDSFRLPAFRFRLLAPKIAGRKKNSPRRAQGTQRERRGTILVKEAPQTQEQREELNLIKVKCEKFGEKRTFEGEEGVDYDDDDDEWPARQ